MLELLFAVVVCLFHSHAMLMLSQSEIEGEQDDIYSYIDAS